VLPGYKDFYVVELSTNSLKQSLEILPTLFHVHLCSSRLDAGIIGWVSGGSKIYIKKKALINEIYR